MPLAGRRAERGPVKPGYLADVLLMNGDPTRNVAMLQSKDNLFAIMKDGKIPQITPRHAMTGADIERRIREHGAVLDMPFTQSVYKPLLAEQRRDGVEVVRDLPYGKDPRQCLDLYRPQPGGTHPCATVLFFHGGGFVRGDKSKRENVGLYFARHGCTVLVPNYRLAPPMGGRPVHRTSCPRTRGRDPMLGQYGGDPGRIFLIGESAGAAHVAVATLVRRFHAEEFRIAGTVLISGVYNVYLEKLAREQFGLATPDPRNEPYFGSDFERYPSISTAHLVDAPQCAPLLITYAELDMPQMQVQAGELFARLVVDHGYRPQLAVIRGHNHLTQLYAVNTGDEALTAPVLKFLDDSLLDQPLPAGG